MPLDPDRLLSLTIPDERRPVADRDLMLYALAVGLGRDDAELDFDYEKALRVVPSFATILAFNDGWLPAGGVPLERVFHAGQRLEFHATLPTGGEVQVSNRIAGLADKGASRPALIVQESQVASADGRTPLATGKSTLFVKDGGGFGGSVGAEVPSPTAPPERPADSGIDIATRPDQPMLFRLLGDRNPLHIDPDAARAAGFDRPILHGACTFGVACAELLRHACGLRPERLASIEARFVAPVFPGEGLRMSLWQDDDSVWFRLESPSRKAVILDSGFARLRSAATR